MTLDLGGADFSSGRSPNSWMDAVPSLLNPACAAPVEEVNPWAALVPRSPLSALYKVRASFRANCCQEECVVNEIAALNLPTPLVPSTPLLNPPPPRPPCTDQPPPPHGCGSGGAALVGAWQCVHPWGWWR